MIRWPQDALIFSVRVRGCGVYAAGYVEGDTSTHELLGARQTSQGLELVSLRGVRDAGAPLELGAVRALSSAGVAPVLDAFISLGSLQPMSSSSLGAAERVVVVERLPADVHLADLSRELFRRGSGARPPVGLALYVAREVARIYAAAPSFPLVADEGGTTGTTGTTLRLTRRADNVLLGWEGTVHVQPRIAVLGRVGSGDLQDEAVVACGRHILRLLACEIPDATRERDDGDRARAYVAERAEALPSDVTIPIARLVRHAVGAHHASESALSLAELIARLDELIVDEPFSRADLAGTLAQLFTEERAQDLAFREELAACDLDALTLPEVKAIDADRDALAAMHLRDDFE